MRSAGACIIFPSRVNWIPSGYPKNQTTSFFVGKVICHLLGTLPVLKDDLSVSSSFPVKLVAHVYSSEEFTEDSQEHVTLSASHPCCKSLSKAAFTGILPALIHYLCWEQGLCLWRATMADAILHLHRQRTPDTYYLRITTSTSQSLCLSWESSQ